jgi:sulfoxide reductase catalytic subunit YedY
MLIRRTPELKYSDVTPRDVYINRRKFLQAMGITAGAALAGKTALDMVALPTHAYAQTKLDGIVKNTTYNTTEKLTPLQVIAGYNNYYEFGTDKGDPSRNAGKFKTSPWTVSVEGEVAKPRKFTMDEILKLAPLEERIYRHRCVEAWSIVVPWVGYSFSALAKAVQPTPDAKYVAFETFWDPRQMPLGAQAGIQFPYVEGLRIDEAMHPLTLLCVGMYDQTLPNQDGAPVRMVIPWKYGFKSGKALVKIKFVKTQPPCTWNIINAHEYGFYSNVNPTVDHPRWSQAKETRLPGFFKNTPTLMFNGYADQVASLYTGMDLKKNY